MNSKFKVRAKKAFYNIVRSSFHRLGMYIVRVQTGQDVYADFQTLVGPQGINVIVDVGANIGQTALSMSAAFPQAAIHSFEPYTPSYETLQQAVAHLPNVRAYNLGFGLENSPMTMHVAQYSVGNSLLEFSDTIAEYDTGAWTQSAGTSTIQIRRLDDWCAENQIDRIDILKIDTQGYELNILRGARGLLAKKCIKAIYLEIQHVPLYKDQADFGELYSELMGFGYHFVDFYNKVRKEETYLKWCDVLFIA